MSGRTPLHYGIEGGHIGVIKYLIEEYNCDPLSPDNYQITTMHLASSIGHLEIVNTSQPPFSAIHMLKMFI